MCMLTHGDVGVGIIYGGERKRKREREGEREREVSDKGMDIF